MRPIRKCHEHPRYPEEFKIEAVKQVTERGLLVADVAARLGMSAHRLYAYEALQQAPGAARSRGRSAS